jgi:hypothetical protein
MSELEFMQELLQLPSIVILGAVTVYIWRKYETLQAKYEALLIDVGELRGKVDTEIRIEQKLQQLYEMQKPKE